jgi:SHS family lactate transporter-like MFS transporter
MNAMEETHKFQPAPASSPDVEEDMSIGRYIATRIPSLIPPMNPAPNPFKALTLLNRQQWLFFAVCLVELILHTKY